jgi:hypothetical protein
MQVRANSFARGAGWSPRRGWCPIIQAFWGYNFCTMLKALAILALALSFVASGSAQRTGDSKATDDQKTVRIILPPKDKYDYWAFGINVALAGIGVLGIGVGVCTLMFIKAQVVEMRRQRIAMQRTLGVIRTQARHMADQVQEMKAQTAATQTSADAAKTSADISAGVSIPTMRIIEFGVVNWAGLTAEDFFRSPRIKMTIRNYGQTPAFLEWWSLCFTCEELPDVPVYEGPATGVVLKNVAVPPGEPYTLPPIEFFRTPTFSDEDVQAIVRREKVFTAYGYICYTDVFNHPFMRFKFCKTVLNIFPEGDKDICDWWEGFSPAAYVGIDQFPVRGRDQEEAQNPN